MIINNIVINNIKTLSVKLTEKPIGAVLEVKQEGGIVEQLILKDKSEEYCNKLLKAIDLELNPKPIGTSLGIDSELSLTQYGLKNV